MKKKDKPNCNFQFRMSLTEAVDEGNNKIIHIIGENNPLDTSRVDSDFMNQINYTASEIDTETASPGTATGKG